MLTAVRESNRMMRAQTMAYPNRYLVAFVGGLGLADESVNLFHVRVFTNASLLAFSTSFCWRFFRLRLR